MKKQIYRNAKGGEIDRTMPLSFKFNGKKYWGYKGDTLASALLANGIHLVGRSFKYHRPRGIFSAGIEEPNGLVQLETGAYSEPNIQVTRIHLSEQLEAKSQNCWPSINIDINAINSKFEKLIPAGFYYKTFMWPKKFWSFYEYLIRKVAGMGVAPRLADPDKYEHRYTHCDILIIGAGPSGLSAALQAGVTNARILLIDSEPSLGGYLRTESCKIAGVPAKKWVSETERHLTNKENVTILRNTIAVAYYDHNMVVLNEYIGKNSTSKTKQRLWLARAKTVILASGSIERPLVFSNNDRPGVMLTSAVLTYARVYGTRAGKNAVVFTNNNSIYSTIENLISSGIKIKMIVDVRHSIPNKHLMTAQKNKIHILKGHVVHNVKGTKKLNSVKISPLDQKGRFQSGDEISVKCDLLCISGGWTPNVHLFSQAQGKLKYDPRITAFVPSEALHSLQPIGSCNGKFALKDCIVEGLNAGIKAVNFLNFNASPLSAPSCSNSPSLGITPLWLVPSRNSEKKFVDFQNDVTTDDIELAHTENYVSVEHLKRYTTLGMGTDQGRLSNVNGLAIMAKLRNVKIKNMGTTTFRAPFTPITMGAVAGPNINEYFIPIRLTSMHENHKTFDAQFIRAGQWLRTQYYNIPNTDVEKIILQEATNTRENAGITDISTLGKIELKGSDITEFLNKIYINNFENMRHGTCRYGVMLREDGMVFDDGTVTKIKEDNFLITTTTSKAEQVLQHLEYFSQVEWPNLDVNLLSVTEEWAGIAIAGPNSRCILSDIVKDIDLSNEACPFMAYREGTLYNIPIRIFRISFSGELAYEINIPANFGSDMWEIVIKVGARYKAKPYGTEAMNILRIEKGHVVGGEINGRTTADDLGLSSMMSASKDFVGKRALERPGLKDMNRPQLVGLTPVDKKTDIPRGGRIINNHNTTLKPCLEGEVTSRCFSPILGHPIALGLVSAGRRRFGETITVVSPLLNESVIAEICDPTFFDTEGRRLRD